MSRTITLDEARKAAWNALRDLADWGGSGTPTRYEEARRIVTAARRTADPYSSAFDQAMDIVDPHGAAFPPAIAAAWRAIKANA